MVFPRVDDDTTRFTLTWRGPLFSRKLFITCPYSRRLLYAITSAQHLYFPHKWCSLYGSPHIVRSGIHKYPCFVPPPSTFRCFSAWTSYPFFTELSSVYFSRFNFYNYYNKNFYFCQMRIHFTFVFIYYTDCK